MRLRERERERRRGRGERNQKYQQRKMLEVWNKGQKKAGTINCPLENQRATSQYRFGPRYYISTLNHEEKNKNNASKTDISS